MQIAKIAGMTERERKRPDSADTFRQRSGREEASIGKADSKEVREKMRREAIGATVAISAEGLARKEEAEEKAAGREQNEKQMYQEMLENTREAAESQGEGFGDLAKALEIARRILNGDIVPAQDEKFLMEFNSEMYMRVKSMAELKEDPEKYDSLLEEEDEDGRPGSESTDGTRRVSETDGTKAEGGTASLEGTDGGEPV